MPTLGANPAHWIGRRTLAAITAVFTSRPPYASAIHCSSPGVEATVFGTVGSIIVIAPASGIGGEIGGETTNFKGNACVSIVQIFRHPPLFADFYSLVSLSVPVVRQGAIFAVVPSLGFAR